MRTDSREGRRNSDNPPGFLFDVTINPGVRFWHKAFRGVKRTFLERSATSAFEPKQDIGRPSPAGSACYFLIIIVIHYSDLQIVR
jgi:hypothetical protein